MQLKARVKAILLTPKTEWPLIGHEPGGMDDLLGYVAVLAAIPAVCGLIGSLIVGVALGAVRAAVLSGLAWAVAHYLLTFVTVFVTALIINALAPAFSAQGNFSNARKLAAYFPTPFWLAGIFSIVPALSFLGILGFYGVYLLWTGLPPLMKAPQDRALGYTAAVVVAPIVIWILAEYGLRRLIGLR